MNSTVLLRHTAEGDRLCEMRFFPPTKWKISLLQYCSVEKRHGVDFTKMFKQKITPRLSIFSPKPDGREEPHAQRFAPGEAGKGIMPDGGLSGSAGEQTNSRNLHAK